MGTESSEAALIPGSSSGERGEQLRGGFDALCAATSLLRGGFEDFRVFVSLLLPLPLPPGEGWGEGWLGTESPEAALTPGPSPGGRGEQSRGGFDALGATSLLRGGFEDFRVSASLLLPLPLPPGEGWGWGEGWLGTESPEVSLTPSPSPGGRGEQLRGGFDALCAATSLLRGGFEDFRVSASLLLPLPPGEGWGEGWLGTESPEVSLTPGSCS